MRQVISFSPKGKHSRRGHPADPFPPRTRRGEAHPFLSPKGFPAGEKALSRTTAAPASAHCPAKTSTTYRFYEGMQKYPLQKLVRTVGQPEVFSLVTLAEDEARETGSEGRKPREWGHSTSTPKPTELPADNHVSKTPAVPLL